MSMPKVPGRDFLKITGIFYTISGRISIISAIIFRFITVTDSTRSIYIMANDYGFQVWKLLPVNSVFAILEKLYSVSAWLKDVQTRSDFWTINKALGMYLTYNDGILFTLLTIIIGIFIVFIGIIAVKHCATLKHTKPLVIFALINLSIMVISTIFFVSFLSVLGCFIAGLYFLGTFINYKEVYKKAK